MTLLADVDSITVLDGSNSTLEFFPVTDVVIENLFVAPDVVVEQGDFPQVVSVSTAGPQGRPGVKNLYVQPTNPATVPGQEWGEAEKGYIWMEADV